jgi:hypothetical protein
VRQGESALASWQLIRELFLDNLAALRKKVWQRGGVLVLRDHSHSQFLFGDRDDGAPTLRDVVAERFPVRSVITTRKVERAFSSMERQGWHQHFSPSTLEEYTAREEHFRSRFEGADHYTYEELTEAPQDTMKALCQSLGLQFSADFEDTFSAFRFSGDSGRGGDVIGSRAHGVIQGAKN